MKDAFFSRGAIEYLTERYPHIPEQMFNGLLSVYGLEEVLLMNGLKPGVLGFKKQTIYKLIIPIAVAEELNISSEIEFPQDMDVIYYITSKNVNSEEPLVSIIINDKDSVPEVIYKGERYTGIEKLDLSWTTKNEQINSGGLTVSIDHLDSVSYSASHLCDRYRGHMFDETD
ncbi:hypothetical protein [Virgibacillus salexigens]|uniref:hypothetical protein n=1 Tax=Virgibacillus salexigens TaxID=61016 RepID=UPI003081BE1D